jgi:hypothetical protein
VLIFASIALFKTHNDLFRQTEIDLERAVAISDERGTSITSLL